MSATNGIRQHIINKGNQQKGGVGLFFVRELQSFSSKGVHLGALAFAMVTIKTG